MPERKGLVKDEADRLRPPDPRSGISADSIGCSALSEVMSTCAKRSRSNHTGADRETPLEPVLIVCLRIRHLVHQNIINKCNGQIMCQDGEVRKSKEFDLALRHAYLGVMRKILTRSKSSAPMNQIKP